MGNRGEFLLTHILIDHTFLFFHFIIFFPAILSQEVCGSAQAPGVAAEVSSPPGLNLIWVHLASDLVHTQNWFALPS